jgi:hypothetical protein
MLHSRRVDFLNFRFTLEVPAMSPQQKYAVFNLLVTLVAMVAYFVLLPILGPLRASGAFGLLGLCGVSAFLLFRQHGRGAIVHDEREQQIWQRATIVAKSVVWVGLIAAFLIALQIVGEQGLVSIRWLALAIWWAFGVFLLVQAAVVLLLAAR